MTLKTSFNLVKKTLLVCLLAGVVPTLSVSAAKQEDEDPAKKKNTKTFTSRNNAAVKIYPDVVKRDMHVVAKENNGKLIDFFVFDVQGTLVQNYKMNPKDHYRLTGLARGIYVYRVFSSDEEIATGKFEIR
jgi:hypothetical protein